MQRGPGRLRYGSMPSTVIRSFDYRADKRELVVNFVSGRCYIYFDVPEREVDSMRAAPSKGRYFNLRIRDRYEFRELVGGD